MIVKEYYTCCQRFSLPPGNMRLEKCVSWLAKGGRDSRTLFLTILGEKKKREKERKRGDTAANYRSSPDSSHLFTVHCCGGETDERENVGRWGEFRWVFFTYPLVGILNLMGPLLLLAWCPMLNSVPKGWERLGIFRYPPTKGHVEISIFTFSICSLGRDAHFILCAICWIQCQEGGGG